jgi:hypothetical protein
MQIEPDVTIAGDIDTETTEEPAAKPKRKPVPAKKVATEEMVENVK